MTNIGHFRAAGKLLKEHAAELPTQLWIAPPTEMPGCSLCMGNQARVEDNCTVVSTSTRNFPNRLGAGADCYLASAEVTAVCAMLGRIPAPEEYQQYWNKIDA